MGLYRIYREQMFAPSWWGILINPFFLVRRSLYAQVRELAPRLHGRVVDLGCGTKPYRHLFPAAEYIGVDVGRAGENHGHGDIDVFYDGKRLPFEDASVDAVFSSEVFEHIFNLEDIVREIRRILKPGGHLLITVPFCWDEHEIPYDFARYTSYGIQDLLKRNDFEITVARKTGHFLETLCQMCGVYMFHFFSRFRIAIRLPLTLALVFPFLLLGVCLRVMPARNTFYMNNVVLARTVNSRRPEA